MTTYYASKGLTITYSVQPWGLEGNADLTLNDLPLPVVQSATYPSINGTQWLVGSVITLVFGTLNAQDVNRLTALSGQTVTFSVMPSAEWTRCTGTCTYNATTKTLTITLTQNVFINPFQVTNPFI